MSFPLQIPSALSEPEVLQTALPILPPLPKLGPALPSSTSSASFSSSSSSSSSSSPSTFTFRLANTNTSPVPPITPRPSPTSTPIRFQRSISATALEHPSPVERPTTALPRSATAGAGLPTSAKQQSEKSHLLYVVMSEELYKQHDGFRYAMQQLTGLSYKIARSIDADLLLNGDTCGLVIRLRHFLLNYSMLEEKVKKFRKTYRQRYLFVLIDSSENDGQPMTLLNDLSFKWNLTLLLAWSWEELARYLLSFKVFERKPPEMLQGKLSDDHATRLEECLTGIRSIQKRDVSTLLDSFETLAGLTSANMADLVLCPGLGATKVQHLYYSLHEPFSPRPPVLRSQDQPSEPSSSS